MVNEVKGKNPQASAVETRYLLMPDEANPYGTAFGGVITAWIDMTASMAAQRHSGTEVVTVSIDSLNFKEPIQVVGEFFCAALRSQAASQGFS